MNKDQWLELVVLTAYALTTYYLLRTAYYLLLLMNRDQWLEFIRQLEVPLGDNDDYLHS